MKHACALSCVVMVMVGCAGDHASNGDGVISATDGPNVGLGQDEASAQPPTLAPLAPLPAGATPPAAGAAPAAPPAATAQPPATAALTGPIQNNDRYFNRPTFWTKEVTGVPKDPQSDTIIAWLDQRGWGGGGQMRIDFGMEVLSGDASTPRLPFAKTEDFFAPDCDDQPMPVPPAGNLEGESGYECLGDGDCHLIVYDAPGRKLYEMWRADIRSGVFRGGCLAVWDLNRTYGPTGRGDQCTSADAAGYPIAPMVINPDEVASGEIKHALRFILPNTSIRAGEYVRPATHSSKAPSGPAEAPPYGVHFRLRADYPVDTLPSQGARVVARAMQKYGMYLSDGGELALSAQSDRHTTAKWGGLLSERDLGAIRPADFEVMPMEPAIPLTLECARN